MSESKSKVPSFHQFIIHQLGDPRHLARFCWNWFFRPLSARSFSDFWRYWNPVYGYVLLFYVYRPIHKRLPRWAAILTTFVVSGFALHDLPFNISADIVEGHLDIPEVTLLMSIFGILVIISESLEIDLSESPRIVRVMANISWLATGFMVRKLVMAVLRHSS